MRLGFFLGFLLGAGIASFLSMTERQEAADDAQLLTAPPSGGSGRGPRQVADKLKQQASEIRTAAREASQQKQADMLREYEETLKHKPEGS